MMSMKKLNNNSLKTQWGTLLGKIYSYWWISLSSSKGWGKCLTGNIMRTKQGNGLTQITDFWWCCLFRPFFNRVIWKLGVFVCYILISIFLQVGLSVILYYSLVFSYKLKKKMQANGQEMQFKLYKTNIKSINVHHIHHMRGRQHPISD